MNIKRNIPFSSVACLILLALFLSRECTAIVIPYATNKKQVKSTYWKVTVDGQDIFVNASPHDGHDRAWVRFKMTGSATVVCTLLQGNITSYSAFPKAYALPENRNGKAVTIKLNEPKKFALRGDQKNDYCDLMIFADAPEVNPPKLGNAKVKNIMDFNPDTTGSNLCTDAIRNAISFVNSSWASQGGGYIYFPRGVYKTSMIKLLTGVKLYLAEDAYIWFSPNNADWGSSVASLCTNNSGWGTGQVYADHADNAGIIGRGIINGSGKERHAAGNGGDWHFIKPVWSSNMIFDGFFGLNNYTWGYHPTNCDNVTFNNVKLVTYDGPWTDGTDIEGSRGTTFRDCFIYTGDDATTFKSNNYKIPAMAMNNNAYINSVFLVTHGSNACRIGGAGENNWNEFKNNRFINCHWFIGTYEFISCDGPLVNDLTFQDCSIEGKAGITPNLNTGSVAGVFNFFNLKYYGIVMPITYNIEGNSTINWCGWTIDGTSINSISAAASKGVTINIKSPAKVNFLANCLSNPTGIMDTAPSSELSLFPNPVGEFTAISYQLKENGAIKIAVYDLMGKEIMQLANEKQNAGVQQLILNTDKLRNGIYLVKMSVDGNQVTKKFVVSK